MKKQLKLTLIASAITAFSAVAHSPVNALVDERGVVVRNSQGDCVETIYNEEHVDCKNVEPAEALITLSAHALFDFDKSIVRTEAQQQLIKVAQSVSKAKSLGEIKEISKVTVTGHTDSRGSVEYNQRLSERRANAIRSFLITHGVPAEMISAYGRGELDPVADNSTEEGRQKNRRVDIRATGIREIKNSTN